MPNALSHLDIFYGELTVHRALVYARLPRPEVEGAWSLAGTVRGPRCLHAQTLPATAKFVNQGPGPTLLAEAILPDPCCWSPDLPAIYDLEVQLLCGGKVVGTERRELGLRRLGVRGRDLFLDGKRWVLRGVSTFSTKEQLPRVWHDASAAYVCDDSNSERLSEASQWGAVAIVHLDCAADEIARRLRDLARYPGIAMAVLFHPLPAHFEKSQVAPNLLLAEWFKHFDARSVVQPWADVVFVSADERDHIRAALAVPKPVVAARYLESPLPLAEARAACDALQRDLAPIGQCAGYVV
jgi:hypothetical protein